MIMGFGDKKKKTTTMEGKTMSLESQLKKRNVELEEELKQNKEREANLRYQLRATGASHRVIVVEDVEECLYTHLDNFEAETLQQAREYHAYIVSLLGQLSRGHSLFNTSIPLHSHS